MTQPDFIHQAYKEADREKKRFHRNGVPLQTPKDRWKKEESHCFKCGETIRSDEDSLCGGCI